MKIYLIHDPLRKDRELLFLKEFEEQGITEWEMVPAVKNLPKITENIAEAHKTCIRRAQEQDLESVIIMEDDVMFSAPGAYNRFLELIEGMEEWDVITSGSYDYKTAMNGTPIMRVERFSALHCYAVHKRYYDKFLDTKVTGNFDKLLKGSLYITYPMLALQHPGFSDSVKKDVNYNITHKRNIKLWTNV